MHRSRFLNEASLAGKLQHPHILPLLDSGEAGNDTAFTVSIDHRDAGSGIGAHDRALTISKVLDRDARQAAAAGPEPRPSARRYDLTASCRDTVVTILAIAAAAGVSGGSLRITSPMVTDGRDSRTLISCSRSHAGTVDR